MFSHGGLRTDLRHIKEQNTAKLKLKRCADDMLCAPQTTLLREIGSQNGRSEDKVVSVRDVRFHRQECVNQGVAAAHLICHKTRCHLPTKSKQVRLGLMCGWVLSSQ